MLRTTSRKRSRRCAVQSLEPRQLLAVDVIFEPLSTISTGEQPESVAAADFDNDGHNDLVVANAAEDSLSFWKGSADGNFARVWADATVQSGPLAIVTGDLNQDGAVDIVTANEFSDSVSVLYGNGDGSFGSAKYIYVPGAHESVALGDLNEDGRLDILVATNYWRSNTSTIDLEPGVHAIFGTANPTDQDGFLEPQLIASSDLPIKIVATDLNNDNHLDVAIAHKEFGFSRDRKDITMMLGDGTGGLSAPIDVRLGGDALGIESADLNGDGSNDLVVVDVNRISVFLNQGNGSFAPEVAYRTGVEVGAATVADLDDDGDLDVAVANSDSAYLTVFDNNGDGTLAARGRFESGERVTSIVAAPLDADSLPELAVLKRQANELSILKNVSTVLPLTVNLDGRGDRYTQDFDVALAGPDGPGARLPVGWSLAKNQSEQRYVDAAFPSDAASGLVSAGLRGSSDRAVAVGVSSATQPDELTWTAEIQQANINSLRVAFDIEAWLADPALAVSPGEASFNVVLEADSGRGFETVRDFGTVTTGKQLTPLLGATGTELWKTDGVNVSQVADIAPGPGSSNPFNFVVFKDALYFVASTNDIYSLYKYDGSEVSLVEELGPCNGRRCRVDQAEGWVAGDALYWNVLPFNRELRVTGDWEILVGPDMFLKIDDAGTSRFATPDYLFATQNFGGTVINDVLLFNLEEWPPSNFGDYELWSFDGDELTWVNTNPGGHPSGRDQPEGVSYGDSNAHAEYNGELYFQSNIGYKRPAVFKSDGTEVVEVIEIPLPRSCGDGALCYRFAVVGDTLYFTLQETNSYFGPMSLWAYDGSTSRLVADSDVLGDYQRLDIQSLGQDELFLTVRFEDRLEFWTTNGTDLTKHPLSEQPVRWVPSVYDDVIFFYTGQSDDGPHTLWRFSEGTLTALWTGVFGGHFTYIGDGDAYLTIDDEDTGVELWKTIGDTVTRVTDINPGPGGALISRLVELNGELLFRASNGNGGPVVLNGNEVANRVQFDSGQIPVQLPAGSKLRLRFGTENGGANVGYLYGIDNFEFEVGRNPANDIPGDANRDGVFDSSDFVQVFLAGEYEDDVPDNSTWEEGDWNNDGDFDSKDIIFAFLAGHYVSAATPGLDAEIAAAIDVDDDRFSMRQRGISSDEVDDLFLGDDLDFDLDPELAERHV